MAAFQGLEARRGAEKWFEIIRGRTGCQRVNDRLYRSQCDGGQQVGELDNDQKKHLLAGLDLTIESDGWVGGGGIICPGVRIGSRTVIGAGSVVTRDIPNGVFAAGNPCRVIREITK
jgi:hypothetical protein